MGLWYRISFVLCLASRVEAQVQVPVDDAELPRARVEAECTGGYDRNSQMDDARLLLSFALGFFVMHTARRQRHRADPDPDGFNNFDFLEDDTPLCQVAVLKLGL